MLGRFTRHPRSAVRFYLPWGTSLGLVGPVNDRLSYNQKLWMRDLLKGATYPPS